MRPKFFFGWPAMRIRLSWKHLLAFFVLVFLIHELHEISHVVTVRLFCGCWGERDFMVWKLCGACNTSRDYAITLIPGPLFNYCVTGTGMYWVLRSKNNRKKSFGFALIFATLPFARIWGTAQGGGDEINAMRLLLVQYEIHKYVLRMLAFVPVMIFCVLPLIVCYRCISNKYKFLFFAGFAFIPLFIDKWVVEGLLNYLTKYVIFGVYRIMGAPLPVMAWCLFLIILLLFFYKRLFSIAVINDQQSK